MNHFKGIWHGFGFGSNWPEKNPNHSVGDESWKWLESLKPFNWVFWGTGILSLRRLRYVKSSKRTWPMVMKFICIEQEIWYIHELCYGGSLEGAKSLYRTHASVLWTGTLLWSLFAIYLPRASTMKAFSIFPHRKKHWDFSANNCLYGGVCFNSSPSPWSCFNTSSIELRIWVQVGAVRGIIKPHMLCKPVMLFGEQFGGIWGEMEYLSKSKPTCLRLSSLTC